MNWWNCLVVVVIVLGCPRIVHLLATTASNSNNNNAVVDETENGCPSKCSCLGDYLDCININLKTVPVIPDWIRSL